MNVFNEEVAINTEAWAYDFQHTKLDQKHDLATTKVTRFLISYDDIKFIYRWTSWGIIYDKEQFEKLPEEIQWYVQESHGI